MERPSNTRELKRAKPSAARNPGAPILRKASLPPRLPQAETPGGGGPQTAKRFHVSPPPIVRARPRKESGGGADGSFRPVRSLDSSIFDTRAEQEAPWTDLPGVEIVTRTATTQDGKRGWLIVPRDAARRIKGDG